MRWTPGGLSSDVEDRRGQSGGGFGGGGLGIVGFIILLVISLVTGRNYIGAYFSSGGGVQQQQQSGPRTVSPQEDRSAQLASFVLGDAQDTWTQILAKEGYPLSPGEPGAVPRLHAVRLRCGAILDWAVLLPRRPEGLSGPRVLGPVEAVRGVRGVRPGIRDCT